MNEPMTYGKISGLPIEIEPAVRLRNYAFFELRWNKSTYTDKEFGGPFVVTVKENIETGQMTTKWFTRNEAMLRFDADDDMVATAWMIDDINWHNRVFLMDEQDRKNPNFMCINYHTRNGTYAAKYINLEIECMREVLKSWVDTVEVLKNGEYLDWFYTEAEADAFIADQAKVVTKVSSAGVISETRFDAKYTKRTKKRFEYRPEIMTMAKLHGRHKYGWTACPEFMDKIKPQIQELIKERRKTESAPEAVTTKQTIMNTLRSLTLKERQDLLGVVSEIPEPKTDETPEVIQEAPVVDVWGQPEPEPESMQKPRPGRPRKQRTAGAPN